jgi:hypothetical protein
MYPACQITIRLSANQRNNGASDVVKSAAAFRKSLGILKDDLVNQFQKKASEATIDAAFEQEGQACSYTLNVTCRFKNPMHHYVIRRFIQSSIDTQMIFHLSPGSKINIQLRSLDAVRQSYLMPPHATRERWLHHSLFCSKAHDLPFKEFVEELGKTVIREQNNLLGCHSWDQYRNQAWTIQILLFSIHEVLLSKCESLPQGSAWGAAGLDVGVEEAPVSLPSYAASTTMHSATTGAVHLDSAETIGATPHIDRHAVSITESEPSGHVNGQRRRKLSFALTVDAAAPAETTARCESPSGVSQARDAIDGQRGITATQLCFCYREADLHFEAGPAASGASASPSAGIRPACLNSLPPSVCMYLSERGSLPMPFCNSIHSRRMFSSEFYRQL